MKTLQYVGDNYISSVRWFVVTVVAVVVPLRPKRHLVILLVCVSKKY
jgi:hypothetical protein